mgnify:CR=1 FL=1
MVSWYIARQVSHLPPSETEIAESGEQKLPCEYRLDTRLAIERHGVDDNPVKQHIPHNSPGQADQEIHVFGRPRQLSLVALIMFAAI